MLSLLTACREREARYLTRTLVQVGQRLAVSPLAVLVGLQHLPNASTPGVPAQRVPNLAGMPYAVLERHPA